MLMSRLQDQKVRCRQTVFCCFDLDSYQAYQTKNSALAQAANAIEGDLGYVEEAYMFNLIHKQIFEARLEKTFESWNN